MKSADRNGLASERKQFPGGRSFHRALRAALRFLNTPRSLSVYLLLKHAEWDQLSNLELGPSQYLDTVTGAWGYWKDAQAIALVRKIPWPTSVSRRERAERTFAECERLCAETNHFIDWLASGVYPQDSYLSACRLIVERAKKLAGKILGSLPTDLFGRFGPGSVYELKESPFATVADKVSITPHVTREAEPLFRLALSNTLWESERLRAGLPFIEYAEGNRFTTVPKDGKTDRGICVEPGGNIWVQLAIGDTMKDRLKRVGLHVARNKRKDDPIQLARWTPARPERTGQDIHRDLAAEASRDGSLATLDLSNASDTVARKLVDAILPAEWATLLNMARSPKTFFNGRWVRLEKFSSMGNGFTFELETLIFVCLAHGVCPHLFPGENIFVYGDDIIIPSSDFQNVVACLRAFGFIPNQKKSFSTGFFRESCGGDYWMGFNVRPYFQKKFPDNPVDWIEFRNGLRKAGVMIPDSLIIGELPTELRLYGPPGCDGTFITNDRSLWKTTRRDGSLWVRRVIPIPLRIPLDRWDEWSHLLLACVGVSSRGLTPRDAVAGFRTKSFSIS